MPGELRQDIVVKENRVLAISASDFRELESSSNFLDLIDSGVVSLLRSRKTPFGIKAYSQVGQAILETGRRIIVEDRLPGALLALLRWALPEDVSEFDVPSAVESDNPVLEIFASNFLGHLGSYLRHGRLKEYTRRVEVSSLPRGRLDIRTTANLMGRGQRGQLAYHESKLSADILPNRLLALGLVAVDAFGQTTSSRADLRSMAQVYSPLFEDVVSHRLIRLPRAELAQKFDDALGDLRVLGDLRSAIAYAKALVLHLGAWPDMPEDILPTAYFLSLQTLFEDALLRVFRETVANLGVSKGKVHDRPLFPDRPTKYVADPDIVVGTVPEVALVADAKYKDVEDYPIHSDVYQLLAHCGALACPVGLLVYPELEPKIEKIGLAGNGCSIWRATVRPNFLREDIAAVWSVMQSVRIGLDTATEME